MSETLPLATVKARFSELIDRVSRQQERVTVTRKGRPAAILISPEDLESLEETLAVLSDPQLMDQLRESDDELGRGESGMPLDELQVVPAARHRTP